jgi:hypothetical protein
MALKPGGIMVHIVWRASDVNPWLSVAKNVVLSVLPPPGEDARTCGPGPISMADQPMVARMMEIAGYEDIAFRQVDAPVLVGRLVDDSTTDRWGRVKLIARPRDQNDSIMSVYRVACLFFTFFPLFPVRLRSRLGDAPELRLGRPLLLARPLGGRPDDRDAGPARRGCMSRRAAVLGASA